jgi:hypothetical protein
MVPPQPYGMHPQHFMLAMQQQMMQQGYPPQGYGFQPAAPYGGGHSQSPPQPAGRYPQPSQQVAIPQPAGPPKRTGSRGKVDSASSLERHTQEDFKKLGIS